MSLVLDGEHAVGPSPLALLPQKILMWGPTVGVIGSEVGGYMVASPEARVTLGNAATRETHPCGLPTA